MLWHSLESQTSITSNTFRLQTSLIITACCFVISFHLVCTTAHVLGSCKVSLKQGRFTFRHDSVLSELASVLSSFIKALPPTPPKRLIKLSFVKAGKSVQKSKVKPTVILHLASNWVIVSDLQNSYIFPGHIALTSLRPALVIFLNSLKRVILIELTYPCEENMESWHSIKLIKDNQRLHIQA